MDLVADAVARPGEDDAVSLGKRLEKEMVVHVFGPGLEGVVIRVGHGELAPDPRESQGLELEQGHDPGGVLDETLVHADGYFLPGYQLPFGQVFLEDFLCQGAFHLYLLSSIFSPLFQFLSGTGRATALSRSHGPFPEIAILSHERCLQLSIAGGVEQSGLHRHWFYLKIFRFDWR
jgi:hypothetical protein